VSAKRGRKKVRTQHPRGVLAAGSDLPRPLRLVVESAERLGLYGERSGGDARVAATLAMDDAVEAAEKIAALAAPFDVFDVLDNVRMTQTMANPEAFKETEHEGLTAIVEFVAVVLACRGDRRGDLPETENGRSRPDSVIDPIIVAARNGVDAASLAIMFETVTTEDGLGGIQLGAALREVFVRNLSYAHMVDDTLDELFGATDIEADCRAAAGCTVAEIRLVFNAIVARTERRWHERTAHMRELTELARVEMAKAKAAVDYVIDPTVKAQGIAAWDAFWGNAGDTSSFQPADLVGETGLPETVVKAVIDMFSYELELRQVDTATQEFFGGRSPLTARPILRDPSGDCVVVHDALLTPAIRGRTEQRLKDAGLWERYAKHRGEQLEAQSILLLKPHLPGCVVYQGFKYLVPDPTAATPQCRPEDYTKLVEGDGLLVLDDVAVVVEDKAGALSDVARTGQPHRLRSDLTKLVTSAAAQAERTRHAILTDGGLRLRDGTWLDLSQVREVHSIAVSLDDLSSIATVTTDLVQAGLLSTSVPLPWTVSLHDLRIICELIDRPAELLLYLRRRTESDVTRRFHAMDELDFFLEFYSSGLFVEPDPDRLRQELPQLGEPSVAAKRRFAKERLQLLTSRTDALDAWYFYRLGMRETAAPKPFLNANADILRLVDFLAQEQAPGWLRVGTSLLDHNGRTQATMARYPDQLARLTLGDGMPHTMAVVGGARADRSFVLVWATAPPELGRASSVDRLNLYVSAKKHQLQVAMGVGLLYDPTDYAMPIVVLYHNGVPGSDPEMDAIVAKLGLVSPERMSRSVPAVLRSDRKRPRRKRRRH